MDLILISLVLGLAASDKLDRSYLPPPGFKYAGGSPGAIDLPLEYPKLTYQTNQELNQNKHFGIPSKIPEDKYSNYLNIQTKNNNGRPPVSFPRQFGITGQPIIETGQYQNEKKYLGDSDNYYNNTKANESYDKAPEKIIGSDNAISTLKPAYDVVKIQYAMNESPELDFQDQEAVNAPKKEGNKFDFTPVLRTDQSLNKVSLGDSYDYRRLPNEKKKIDAVKEAIYGKDSFVPNIPSGNNMYKDSNSYGSQDMYRPDKVAPVIGTSPTSTPKPSMDTIYLNSKQDTSIQSYSSENRSQTSPNYPFGTILTEQERPSYKRPERPQAESERNAFIVKYKNVITPEGFSYSYDTSNGIHADEDGIAMDGVRAQGSYSYTGDDGKIYTIKYTADENGYRPFGDHLPTPPPVPVEIQAALNQIAREQKADDSDDGSYDEKKYGYKNYEGAMDRYDPHLQDLTKNIKGTQRISSDNIKKYPLEFINKLKDIVKDDFNTQSKSDYPNLSLTDKVKDINYNTATVNTPYSRNEQNMKYYNPSIQNRPDEIINYENNTPRIPAVSKIYHPEDKSRFEDSNFKTTSSGDNIKNFRPSYKTSADLVEKPVYSDINRYLPEYNQNKLGSQLKSEKPFKVTNIDIGNLEKDQEVYEEALKKSFEGDNLSQPKIDDLNKTFGLKKSKPQSPEVTTSAGQTVKNTPGIDEMNGFSYNLPDNFKGTPYNNIDTTSIPSSDQYSSDDNENISTLRTNYDRNTNNYFNSALPSTTDDAVTSTDKYFDSYTDDKLTTPDYQFTQNYYNENTPSYNYDSGIPVESKPFDQFTESKTLYSQQDKPRVTQKTPVKPSQEFKYTQSQVYTTPMSVGTRYDTEKMNNYDRITVNIPSTTLSPFNYGMFTQLDTQKPFNKNSDVFTGYVYDKPNYNNNQLNGNYKTDNSNNFPSGSYNATGMKDANFPNRYNFSNQEDNFSVGTKVPKYNLIDNSREPNNQFVPSPSKPTGDSYEESQYLRNKDVTNKPQTKQTDTSIEPYIGDVTENNQKNQNSNRNYSNYDRTTEINQYPNILNNQKAQKPINNENGTLDGSRYTGVATDRPEFVNNELVLGEDFSGPKRPQGFDPATGYYY